MARLERELGVALLRGTTEAFASRLLDAGVSKSNALELLVIAGFVRGLSVRDAEATLAEALGAQAALSMLTAPESASRSPTSSRPGAPDRWSRCAWTTCSWPPPISGAPGQPGHPDPGRLGITTHGKPQLVALDAAAAESTDAWDEFIDELADRGLHAPLLVISDEST